MEIDIVQHPVRIGDKYSIFIDNKEKYKGVSKIFVLLSEISLYRLKNVQPRLVIKRDSLLFFLDYKIIRGDKTYIFNSPTIGRIYYVCNIENDKYEIFGHWKNRFSIFKNGKQIAFWKMGLVTFAASDVYMVKMNDNEDLELIIAFVLIIDNFFFNNRGQLISLNFGPLGFPKRKFDELWTPNKIY